MTQARVASVEKAWKQRRASRAAGVSSTTSALTASARSTLRAVAASTTARSSGSARSPARPTTASHVSRLRSTTSRPAATLCARRSSSGVSGPAVRTSASSAPPCGDDRHEHAADPAEVVVDERAGDARGLGHVGRRDARVGALGEEHARGLEDEAAAGVGAQASPAGDGRGRVGGHARQSS